MLYFLAPRVTAIFFFVKFNAISSLAFISHLQQSSLNSLLWNYNDSFCDSGTRLPLSGNSLKIVHRFGFEIKADALSFPTIVQSSASVDTIPVGPIPLMAALFQLDAVSRVSLYAQQLIDYHLCTIIQPSTVRLVAAESVFETDHLIWSAPWYHFVLVLLWPTLAFCSRYEFPRRLFDVIQHSKLITPTRDFFIAYLRMLFSILKRSILDSLLLQKISSGLCLCWTSRNFNLRRFFGSSTASLPQFSLEGGV